jgi:uncharacterized protein YbjT (DUF2867 family)
LKKTAAIAGATGLVGSRLLSLLLDDPRIERVVAPTRRALPPHLKLSNPLSGSGWPVLQPVDEAYCCLGTTRKDAGSDAAFRAVDLDLTVAFARAARAAVARSFGLVSSAGANAASSLLYPRTKGEVEKAVAGLGFETLVIARPSLLLGAREKPRSAEKLGESVLSLAKPFLVGPLRKYRAIAAADVAAALIGSVRGNFPGTLTLESDALVAH